MEYKEYINEFEVAKNRLDQSLLKKKELEVWVGIKLDSVVLKLYKKNWTNDPFKPLDAKSRIFFSVWMSDQSIAEQKVYYNIHALKLRELNGYCIKSRDFADSFRKKFNNHQSDWQNVTTSLGPLTLMEGFKNFDEENLNETVYGLANDFIKMEQLVDDTLRLFSKK
ncbi:MAG: hypothetical protein ABIP95_01670 [Pelobium sp.]